MAVTLRLQRHGTHKRPFYHVVVADSRKPRDGEFIEKLGHYDPTKEPSVVALKEDRVRYWYERGATVSIAVRRILGTQKLTVTRAKTKPRPTVSAKKSKAKAAKA